MIKLLKTTGRQLGNNRRRGARRGATIVEFAISVPIFLLFLPLLIVACLCGMYEQKMEQIEQREAGAGHADVPAMHSGA